MGLARHEHDELAGIERALSADRTLCAVAGLFAVPLGPRTVRPMDDVPDPKVSRPRAGRPSVARSVEDAVRAARRLALITVLGVLVAVAGLTCVAFAVASGRPDLLGSGVSLTVLSALLWAFGTVGHARMRYRSRSTLMSR